MIDKLNSEKERAVVRSIETIIDESRHRPAADLNKIAADVFATQNFTPELVKRACEAYNKSKSVYMLSKLSSQSRAEAFPLIDPADVITRLYNPKTAEETLHIPTADFSMKVDFERVMTLGISKTAGELQAEVAPPAGNREWSADKQLHKSEQRLNHTLKNMESKCDMHKLASMDAMHKAIDSMEKMTPKQLAKAQHIIVNKYGDDGARFIKIASATLARPEWPLDRLDLRKTASAVVLPLEEPYTSIDVMVKEAREHVQIKNLLAKTSAELMEKTSGGIASLFREGANLGVGLSEGVASGLGKTLDPVVEFAKTPIYAEMTKEHKSPKYEEVMDPVLSNELKQIESTQSFVDVASDDFVKNYPIQDITEAYNNTVSTMPELQNPKYKPWLKSLVKQQLVQGNVFDQETINQYMTMKAGLSRSDKERADAHRGLMESLKKEPAPGMSESMAAHLLLGDPREDGKAESLFDSKSKSGKGGGGDDAEKLKLDKVKHQHQVGRDASESKYRLEKDIADRARQKDEFDLKQQMLDETRNRNAAAKATRTVERYNVDPSDGPDILTGRDVTKFI